MVSDCLLDVGGRAGCTAGRQPQHDCEAQGESEGELDCNPKAVNRTYQEGLDIYHSDRLSNLLKSDCESRGEVLQGLMT